MNQCFQDNPQPFQLIYEGMEDLFSSPAAATNSAPDTHSHAILYDLSVLKDKVQHVRSLVIAAASPRAQHELVAAAVDGTAALVDDVIATATSSMMFAFRQMKPYEASSQANDEVVDHAAHNSSTASPIISDDRSLGFRPTTWCDVVELDAGDLLARYTHYCHVCGKGFRRDANLRMHMRAHGDEYKTAAALSNPTGRGEHPTPPRKYSCPEEGCRWNRRHAKFKPLKSMICAKNHYKRSHCPKMYVCNRCGRKRFSVLSDLRTHEKHCGDPKWRCSCGTSFSRKDKLMGHLALFVGHTPAMDCFNTQGAGVQRSMG